MIGVLLLKTFIKKSLNSNNLNHFTPDKKLLKLYEMHMKKLRECLKTEYGFGMILSA